MAGIDGILKDGDKKGEPEFAIVLLRHTLAQRLYRYNLYLLNHIFLYIENIDIVLLNAHARASNRNFLQSLQNHPVDGARVVFRQVPVKRFIDFPDVGGTVNNDRTVVLRRDLFRQGRRHRCGEVANDLLENIFHGDQPLDIAIFVDDQSDFLFYCAEI